MKVFYLSFAWIGFLAISSSHAASPVTAHCQFEVNGNGVGILHYEQGSPINLIHDGVSLLIDEVVFDNGGQKIEGIFIDLSDSISNSRSWGFPTSVKGTPVLSLLQTSNHLARVLCRFM